MTVSSLLIFMIVLFLALAIFLGTPIAVALGLAAVAELILQGEVPLMIAAQRIFNGVNSVTLMGIPFFMLVGSIMERSGITQKLIDFANSLVGWLRGGLCYVGRHFRLRARRYGGAQLDHGPLHGAQRL